MATTAPPPIHPSIPKLSATLPSTTSPRAHVTNAALNLSVLRRHNPQIHDILSIAPYAVIYIFSPRAQTWEKSGVEGAMFVCSLFNDDGDASAGDFRERYNVTVLNRRGLDNFSLELTCEDDVEITPEYVILQGPSRATQTQTNPPGTFDGENVDGKDVTVGTDGQEAEQDRVIYGLWIFAEKLPSSTAQMRDVNARLIVDCAARAEASRKESQRLHGGVHSRSSGIGAVGSGPGIRAASLGVFDGELAAEKMSRASSGYGRQHGLDFGRQEAQHWWEPGGGAGADVGAARSAAAHGLVPGAATGSADVLGDLFRRARQGRVGGGNG